MVSEHLVVLQHKGVLEVSNGFTIPLLGSEIYLIGQVGKHY